MTTETSNVSLRHMAATWRATGPPIQSDATAAAVMDQADRQDDDDPTDEEVQPHHGDSGSNASDGEFHVCNPIYFRWPGKAFLTWDQPEISVCLLNMAAHFREVVIMTIPVRRVRSGVVRSS